MTLLGNKKRKVSVKFGKDDILLMLRSYREHPCSLPEVIETMKQNLQLLPPSAQELYTSSTMSQLRDRLATKLGKLTAMDPATVKDLDTR